MSTAPWLTIMLIVPAVGSLLVALLPRRSALLAKQLALAVSLVVLVLAVLATAAYDPDKAGFQFGQKHEWIKQFGVSYSVGADGISLVLMLLAALLVPVVVLASWDEADNVNRSVPAFFALLLALETGMIGVFAATDVFLFYVFFEAMLIPMYFLIGSYGPVEEKAQRSYAAVKFLLYSLFGGLLMLAAVIGLYVLSSQQFDTGGTFDFATLRQHLVITPDTQKLLFLGFFIAFAIKAPLFPFHTWLPDAGAQSPTGGAVLLVGVLDKVGTFGLIRYCIPLFPDASEYFAPMVLALAVIGIFYGALLAIGQRDMKRLVAYTSLAHFGFIALGTFAFTSQAGTGAVLYMVNHGLSTGLLFVVVGFLVSRQGSRDVGAYGGMAQVTPMLAGVFLIAGLSSLALPGTNSFVSEFLVLVGTFTEYRALAIVATCGIVLAAIYILFLYQRTMTGPVKDEKLRLVKDLSVRERVVVAPMVALIIGLGVYPKPLLDIITPAVTSTFEDIGKSDPAPTAPVAATQSGGHS
ncbi:NADH-quinone oxidoreductase subunit M [Frankia sp. CcI49]|uniref:NADH-quinone oxidoreductase subunit M n=1 Tax=Parafrankia irregularis TaxID=795642 RepID=A0A0S4QFL5_9ACTN|nr:MULTISPECIES: NADH-quinone oxidoreductase subunit M [Frankiaceae]EFC85594.1 proton-translocating NADH-quinone oxidoreductase, chain M [Parafrankia sp. EUN1f]KPM51227.1 NADH:ubiquinone oxidoreductase subunit M [Frankia sp. R43]MBE3203093.1 NADH-quinone oxidoreductase subunit M [Parafrankia sp. CH37]ONH59544.1 NADH-quinone oxidoreductase subunit M [Frankia sp. CcI49]CUU54269.1 NADH-quinone oxidoreductase subunit M [Parafrankia irregularis]